MYRTPLDARTADHYSQYIKSVISSMADPSDLISTLTTYDEQPVNKNSRLIQVLKQSMQTIGFGVNETQIINDSILSLDLS